VVMVVMCVAIVITRCAMLVSGVAGRVRIVVVVVVVVVVIVAIVWMVSAHGAGILADITSGMRAGEWPRPRLRAAR